MIKNLQETNHFLMLAAGGMLIGFAPIFVKWSYLSPSAISFWRMFLAIPLLLAFNFLINQISLQNLISFLVAQIDALNFLSRPVQLI